MKFSGRMLLALAAAGLIALLLFRAFERVALIRARGGVSEAQQSTRDTDALFSDVLDAESAQRGYLLTGDEDYLNPYRVSLTAIPVLLAAVERDSMGLPETEGLTRQLSRAVKAKLAELAKTVELRSNGDLESSLRAVQNNVGRNLMGKIRRLSKQLRDNYFGVVDLQSRRLELYSFWGLVFEMSVGGLILLLLVAGALQLMRGFKAEQKLMEDVREKELRYKMLAARIQSAREDERTALARDIHDDLGQALTGIKIDLAMLSRQLDAEQREAASQRLDSSLVAVDSAIQSLRRVSRDLRPAVLDQVGLSAALRAHGREFGARTGIRVEFDLIEELLPMNVEQRTALFRIAQEALTNVARHARAQSVRLTLANRTGDIHLNIRDDGVGIPARPLGSGTSLGLLGMEERAHLVGARLKLTTERGKGTTVEVVLGHAMIQSTPPVINR
ncbi:MAG TPA: CHASE3 domain-containing protein [Bryobacteraceae bacterium]|nr:CHASE3 domain-containing protein [Bryobacteraceae bacterium]